MDQDVLNILLIMLIIISKIWNWKDLKQKQIDVDIADVLTKKMKISEDFCIQKLSEDADKFAKEAEEGLYFADQI